MLELFAGLCLLANTGPARAAAMVQQQVHERKAWDAFLEREEHHAEKLQAHLRRLGDAQVLLREQFGRIERKEHLDIAGLRVEQILKVVAEVNEGLAATEKEFANAPQLPFLIHKREELAKLSDAKNGKIVRTRHALTRLLNALEIDRAPDLRLAVEAKERLDGLEHGLSRFVNLIDPITCYSLAAYLVALERRQRELTIRLYISRFRIERPGPMQLLEPRKDKDKK
ncbi:MAG: hypothetical protein EXR98_12545 [Gemmataceae bacterium]|nr:hypothetical protein [Gemmataceae bacterium]